MNTSDLVTIDFETYGIEDRPLYPPVPVGVAIRYKKKSKYLAWGHPTQNNCTFAEAKRELNRLINSSISLLFHNAAFDVSVGQTHMGWGKIPWHRIHDTLLLSFLHDPRDDSLSLKPMSEKYLNIPPDEQDKLKEWILNNVEGAHDHRKSKHPELFWGALISETPGKLCAKYAKGDVDRTEKMFHYFYPIVINHYGMGRAYDRERRNLPLFEVMSDGGAKIRRVKLGKDIKIYQKKFDDFDKGIQKHLKTTFDVGSAKQLGDVLDKQNAVDGWEYTEKGNKSTKRDNLIKHIKNKKLLYMLAARGLLANKLGTFMIPWYEKSEYDGYVYPTFNQVRSTDDYFGGNQGTRTGRPSSKNPNFLNVPRNLDEDYEEKPWTIEAPNMRDYIMPDEGMVFNNRDYNQQEIRILAHFEMGTLWQAFKDDPTIDAHEFARQLIHRMTGTLYARKHIKITVFGVIYGMGLEKLADQRLHIPKSEAKKVRDAYFLAFPDVDELRRDIKEKLTAGEFIRTWGGRVYYEQEPLRNEAGRIIQDFKYKMLNYLVQGSAADCTKEAMINVVDNCRKSRLVLQVYDELMICSPKALQKQEMKKMKEGMQAVKFDIPMLSDGKTGGVSWARMKKCA